MREESSIVLRSRAEYLAAVEHHPHRHAYERLIMDVNVDRGSWTMPAICEACDEAVELVLDWSAGSPGVYLNFRERLVCPRCGLSNRQRHMAGRLLELDRPGRRVYMNEQVTPFYAWARDRLDAEVVGSEYLGSGIASGEVRGGLRHEDSAHLSFEEVSFDAVVSQDVFEHVPDVDASFRECARILRPGGRLLFTIPFHFHAETTVRRAEIRDGELIELEPAEYHGNPVNPEAGSLVFHDHSWDVLGRLRAAGFADAWVLGYWSVLYGYLGQGMQFALVAEKR